MERENDNNLALDYATIHNFDTIKGTACGLEKLEREEESNLDKGFLSFLLYCSAKLSV